MDGDVREAARLICQQIRDNRAPPLTHRRAATVSAVRESYWSPGSAGPRPGSSMGQAMAAHEAQEPSNDDYRPAAPPPEPSAEVENRTEPGPEPADSPGRPSTESDVETDNELPC